jgi:hypothetical protein
MLLAAGVALPAPAVAATGLGVTGGAPSGVAAGGV